MLCCKQSENKENIKIDKDTDEIMECYGVSNQFRLFIQLEGTSQSGGQTLNPISQFTEEIDSIRMYVHPCFKTQHSSSLMPLLNLCNLFHKENRK